ncbi:hypothetical protein AMTR_s00085p00112760 [Amborella trichopoda]|uniref:Pectate lyase superfamily protein domain-containing protein n=3 Tax=Amborella trichopoda TaxID=13333 RepID=W1NYN0_AMBTC|nr:hypothetical protein AMTR_s00085p00112760 [Amborella trichopoda]
MTSTLLCQSLKTLPIQKEMVKKCPFPLVFFVLIGFLILGSSPLLVEARSKAHKHHKKRGSESKKDSPVSLPTPPPYYGSYQPTRTIFDILSFGAKGDGVSDDSKSLLAAWRAACKVGSAIVEIPSEFRFLISAVTLQGPCMPQLVLQIDGTVIAPSQLSAWPNNGLLQWINFKWVQNFSIQGTGTIDGQGSAWWGIPDIQSEKFSGKSSKYIPSTKPTAVRFYASYNVTIRDVAIINSPLCHLKFDNCGGVKVLNITISSPGDSPNTDGIHIQNTQDVEVEHSTIGCGDDCVSIQTGCSNVNIHHINCGPGHGISLGSLGKDNSLACVYNVTVQNITIQDALSGVRIKTWQGGLGSVKNISFSGIQVSNVRIPIVIDQFYCDKKRCKNQTGAVEIEGIKYDQITGTYAAQPIHLACSDAVPCTNIDLNDIQLEPSQTARGIQQGLCWNSYGKSQAPLIPSSINCLQKSGNLAKSMRKSSHPKKQPC